LDVGRTFLSDKHSAFSQTQRRSKPPFSFPEWEPLTRNVHSSQTSKVEVWRMLTGKAVVSRTDWCETGSVGWA